MEDLYVSKEKFLKVSRIIEDSSEDVSFTFLFASLFPSAWENVQAALRREHLAGFQEGMEAAKLNEN